MRVIDSDQGNDVQIVYWSRCSSLDCILDSSEVAEN